MEHGGYLHHVKYALILENCNTFSFIGYCNFHSFFYGSLLCFGIVLPYNSPIGSDSVRGGSALGDDGRRRCCRIFSRTLSSNWGILFIPGMEYRLVGTKYFK